MKISVVTLFPEAVEAFGTFGVTGRATHSGQVAVTTRNPRDYCKDAHRTADDRPYGGGPGMVMKAPPLAAAVADARQDVPPGSRVVLMSPQGRRFTQATAELEAARQLEAEFIAKFAPPSS